MSERLQTPSEPDYIRTTQRTCPQCGGSLDRMHRRLIDRLASLFAPVQRYRCRNFSCRWEGNLRKSAEDAQSSSLQ